MKIVAFCTLHSHILSLSIDEKTIKCYNIKKCPKGAVVMKKKNKIILINEKYRCFLEDYFSKYESIIDDKTTHAGCLG